MSKSVFRPTRANISLDNLVNNLNSVREFIGEDKLYMAVVKADAYGHGALECAVALENAGADWFGVAIPEEGIKLRKAGIRKRILSLGGFWKGQERSLLNNSITPVIFDLEHAALFDRAAEERGVESFVHVKIDTGMGRIGVPFDGIENFVREFSRFSNLRVEGLMTHFAAADDLRENEFTQRQIDKFNSAVEVFSDFGLTPIIVDLANSPGAIAHPSSRGNLVRLGGVLYGLDEDILPDSVPKPDLRPVMSITSEVTLIKRVKKGSTLGYGRTFETERDSVVATVPIGYQDGYMRAFSNNARTLVRGMPAPVVGRVSMDWTLIDITDIPEVETGDKVTLLGHDGPETITAAELAAFADTISYEVTCGINSRVKRFYEAVGPAAKN